MPVDYLGLALLVLGVVVAVSIAAAAIRRVPPDERLVLARAGRFDQSSLRGPGLVFLVPIIDRGIRVSLLPQHFELDAIPATTADGAGVLVDVDIRFRVVDPVAFVSNVLPPPAGLRVLTRGVLLKVLQAATPGEALFPGDVEREIAPLIEGILAAGGARDVAINVTRLRRGSVVDAEEAEFQAFARQEGIELPRQPKAKSMPQSRDIPER